MPASDHYDVTVGLDYYAPYVSGLTESARILAEGLAARGWRVAVVCARHHRSLPRHEKLRGVDVYRAPVLASVRKGVLSPGLPRLVARTAAQSSVLHLHLPMPESAFVTWLVRGRTPVLATYHIDAFLPGGLVDRVGVRAADRVSAVTVGRSAAVVVNSHDQAQGSRIWPALRQRPLFTIPPACIDRSGGAPRFRETSGTHIGFMGRIAAEKGIKYLIRALREIEDPDIRLLLAGDYETVAGPSTIDELRAEGAGDDRVRILGLLRGSDIDDFYASIDVFALPSIAESFGIVQAEAMMTGVPSVTTDIPGGRYPVQATGFGRLVPPRNPDALRTAVCEVAGMTASQRELGRKQAIAQFGGEAYVDAYEEALRSVQSSRAGRR